MQHPASIGITLGILALGGLTYWQIVIAEGAYLGQRIVTWLYDITANRYNRIKQYQPSMERRFLGQPLVQALRHIPAPLILDIATGTGRLPLALFEQPAFQGHVIGLDHSRPMLVVAAHKSGNMAHRFPLVWCDAARLPFPDDTFDAVTCLEMLEFTPDPIHQIAEAVRVLRPGGILLTTRRRGFDATLMPGKTHSLEHFHNLLEQTGLIRIQIESWQVDYDLVWAEKEGTSGWRGIRPLAELIRCPVCQHLSLDDLTVRMQCTQCHTHYPVRDGIINMNSR